MQFLLKRRRDGSAHPRESPEEEAARVLQAAARGFLFRLRLRIPNDDLKQLVDRMNAHWDGFVQLFFFVIFIVLFFAVVSFQKPPTSSFSVEKRLRDVIMDTTYDGNPGHNTLDDVRSVADATAFFRAMHSSVYDGEIEDSCNMCKMMKAVGLKRFMRDFCIPCVIGPDYTGAKAQVCTTYDPVWSAMLEPYCQKTAALTAGGERPNMRDCFFPGSMQVIAEHSGAPPGSDYESDLTRGRCYGFDTQYTGTTDLAIFGLSSIAPNAAAQGPYVDDSCFSGAPIDPLCQDDLDGHLAAAGTMCSALLVKAACDMDLNDVDSQTPRGMVVKHLCPKSCGQCSVTEPTQAQSTNQTGFDYGLCSIGMVNTQQLSMGVVGNSQHFMTMLKSDFECVDSPGFLHWLASEWPGSGMPTSCADVAKFGLCDMNLLSEDGFFKRQCCISCSGPGISRKESSSNDGCKDDPDGHLALGNTNCGEMLSSLSCDADVHAFDSNSPPGTYLKTFCPASCNYCGANATHAAANTKSATANASDTSCIDDPDGHLAAASTTCSSMLASGTCDTDLHQLDPNTPVGTLIKGLCPRSCDTCSRRKRRKLKLNTFVHPSFTVLSNIKWADVHRKLGALSRGHGRQLEGFTVDKEARNWAYETWLSTSKLSQQADQSSWDACKKGFQGEKQFTWTLLQVQFLNKQHLASSSTGYLDKIKFVGGAFLTQKRRKRGNCTTAELETFPSSVYDVCFEEDGGETSLDQGTENPSVNCLTAEREVNLIEGGYPDQFNGDKCMGSFFKYSHNFSAFLLPIDLGVYNTGLNSMQCQLKSMIDKHWVDSGTKELTYTMMVFNPMGKSSAGLYGFADIKFEFEMGGYVSKTITINTFPHRDMYKDNRDMFRNVLEICLFIMWLGYVLCEGVLFYRGVRQHGTFYLLDFWFLIRVAALAVMLVNIVQWRSLVYHMRRGVMEEQLDLMARHSIITDKGWDAILHIYSLFRDTAKDFTSYQITIAISTLLNVLSLFKMLRFHGRVSLVTETITLALVELGHFVIIAGYIIAGYSFLAWQVLGTQLEKFRTFGGSFEQLCRWGLFYEHEYDDWLEINPVFLPVIYYTYMLLVGVVLLNVLLGIVVDAYILVKESSGKEPDAVWVSLYHVLQRMGTYVSFHFWEHRRGSKVGPTKQAHMITKVLSAWGRKNKKPSLNLKESVQFLKNHYVPAKTAEAAVSRVLREQLLEDTAMAVSGAAVSPLPSLSPPPPNPPTPLLVTKSESEESALRAYFQVRLAEAQKVVEETAKLLATLPNSQTVPAAVQPKQ